MGWWPLDGNGTDESESENHGTVYGAMSAVDRWNEENSCMNFLNNGDRIELGEISTSIGAPYNGLTISCWFKGSAAQEINRSGQLVAANYGPGSYQIRLEVVHDISDGPGNHLKYYWRCPNENDEPVSESEFDTGSWNNYLMVVDPNLQEISIFLNGAEITDLNAAYNPANDYFGENDRNWMIGAHYPSPNSGVHQFYGSIDDVGIWSRALTNEEIIALYNTELSIPGCTDTTACNFDAEATSDDGSCVYPPSESVDCEFGGNYCGEGTIWDASLQACVAFDDCPADLNGNGLVEVSDLLMVLADFGTECAPPVSEFTCGDPVSYHGYDYATVQIGEQCWFAENLRTELYSNGDTIPGNLSNEEWASTTEGAQAISIYGDALEMFGRAYNGYAVGDERGLCLSGWHVALDSEWKELEMELGMSEADANSGGWRGTDQGIQMKTTTGWSEGENGTNSSGFSAKPAGNRTSQGHWTNTVHNAFFWTPASSTGSASLFRHLRFEEAGVFRGNYGSGQGLSIRCLKD